MKLLRILAPILLLTLLGCTNNPEKTDSAQVANNGDIDRTILPIQSPKTAAVTEMDARNVETPEHFEIKAPEGAPNVVVVLIDDIGFGATSTFGVKSIHLLSTGWRTTACALTVFIPPPYVRRRGLRYFRVEITTT